MPILHFKGKSVIQNHHHTVKFHELEAVKGKGTSKEPSLDDNLIIQGDNLIALKALLPTYAGKVKCIYIDPPYNTGNEHWIYNDNVNSPMIKEWIGKEVARDDLSRHDKWCCMIYPRLTLLRDLLHNEGIIFISIDDNEVQYLRMMLDEVFGESNFLAQFVWKARQHKDTRALTNISTDHEYILAYGRSENVRLLGVKRDESKFSNPDNDPRGDWMSRSILGLATQEQRPNLHFDLIDSNTGHIFCPPANTGWRYSKETMQKLMKGKKILFPKKKDGRPREKKFRSEMTNECVSFDSIIDDVFTADGTAEVREIFGEQAFDFPKPSKLISRLVEQATDQDSVILDSFAGSGTTAHAVLALNAEDGGNRRFILVECEDYADKITAERVRRVSKGVKDAKDENLQKGLGGTFSYYKIGKPIDIDRMLDGDDIPSFESLANYAFFTATGETFNPKKVNEKDFYIGSSSTYEVFLLYVPDAAKLRGMALNLDFAEKIEKKFPRKQKLVFAPACFLEEFDLRERNIRFAQLPFEIYRLAE